MQSHFTIIISLVVLAVIAVIVFRKKYKMTSSEASYKNIENSTVANDFGDDCIIAVRKRERVLPIPTSSEAESHTSTSHTQADMSATKSPASSERTNNIIAVYVMAKPNKHFAGYELLQSLLTSGMRFGEMNIFHRYHEITGRGPVLFSLASATEPGTFDIHNMGAFSGHGLTIFMQKSGNVNIDLDRFDLMIKTAQQLTEDMDGILLDEKRELLSKDKIAVKKQTLGGFNQKLNEMKELS